MVVSAVFRPFLQWYCLFFYPSFFTMVLSGFFSVIFYNGIVWVLFRQLLQWFCLGFFFVIFYNDFVRFSSTCFLIAPFYLLHLSNSKNMQY